MSDSERRRLLAKVDELYAEYGRGHDGMQVPYITRCYRAVVRHRGLPPETSASAAPPGADSSRTADGERPRPRSSTRNAAGGPGMQLIDFK